MPWKDKLKQLKSEWDSVTSQPLQHAAQHLPSQGEPPKVYWQLDFTPQTPTRNDWDLKVGGGGWGNDEKQHYSADAANSFYTQDKTLVLRAIADHNTQKPENQFTSARLVSKQTLARDRGVLTGTISSPCAAGIWPAFWLLPKEPFSWPDDGEIDIAETWNGDHENKTCLHWGQHNDPQKHRVLGTKIPHMSKKPVRYDFAWDQPGGQAGQGRLLWYIDGKPVMKADIPSGTRPMRDFTVLLNIAMGGNVCGGQVPADGSYEMTVHTLYMAEEPENGGWKRFDSDWRATTLGNTY